MNKRIAAYAVIAVIIASSLSVFAYHELTTPSSPFNNRWTASINGQPVYSVIADNSSYVVSSYTNSTQMAFSYQVTRMNLTTGSVEWTSPKFTFYGIDSQFMVPYGRTPNSGIFNGILYFADFTGSSDLMNFNTTGNFYVVGINTASGAIVVKENITPPGMTYMNTFGYSVVFLDNSMVISFMSEVFSPNGNGPLHDAFFETSAYTLGDHGVTYLSHSATPVPQTQGWGTGSESMAQSGSLIVYELYYAGKAVALNASSNHVTEFNLSQRVIGISGNDVYESSSNNSTVSFSYMDLQTSQTHQLFSFIDPVLNSSNYYYTATLLPSGVIAFESQIAEVGVSDLSGSPLMQDNISYMGFSQNGRTLWNLSLVPDNYGTTVNVFSMGSGKVVLTTRPAGFSRIINYHTDVVVIDPATGKLISHVNYGYSINFPSDKTAFMSPPPFYGILGHNNNTLIYKFGSSIACASV